MPTPRAIVLRAPGTNCDEETVFAWQKAGALAESWHVSRWLEKPEALDAFQVLTLPGGFSYGDDLGAGRVLAARLGSVLGDAIRRFRDRGGLILGICNGFQVLVRAGLLPGGDPPTPATLTLNASGRFESRWVRLLPSPGLGPFLADNDPFELPVAHGEGMFVLAGSGLASLESSGQVALRYLDDAGHPTGTYPANPNGSSGAVAGLTDPTGRIFGLMPHPERFAESFHHPRWTRRADEDRGEGAGMRIFRNAVKYSEI